MPSLRVTPHFPWPFARICAVDLGASHVTAAVYRGGSRRPRLLRRASVRFGRLPETDLAWVAEATAAMGELMRDLRFRGPAILGLAPHLVLTKQVTTPAVDFRQRDKVVLFEVTQAIPLALDEIVWESSGDFAARPDWQLTFSIAKREVVEALVSAATAAGGEVQGIYPSGRALAAEWNAAEAGSPAVVIEVGARSTTVLVRGAEGFRERCVPVGGQLVTRGLAKELNLPLTEIEARLGTAAKAELPGAVIDPLVEQLAAGLVLEIGQVEGRLSEEGHTSGRILVTGGAARLPGLAARLTEYLGVRVERITGSLRDDESDPGEPSVVTGLVRLHRGKAGGGLLPDGLRARIERSRRLPGRIALGLLPVAALIPPLWHYTLVKRAALARVESLVVQTREMEQCARRNSAILLRIAEMRTQCAQVRGLIDRRGTWIRILSDLQQAVMDEDAVWLEELATVPPGGARPARPTLRLRGRMLNLDDPRCAAESALGDGARSLLDRIRRCEGVESVADERFDLSEPGSLRFEASVVLAGVRTGRKVP